MKRIAFILILAVALAVFSGCKIHGHGVRGSGNRKTETRDLKSFKAIDTTGAYTIDITCQKPASFEIETDDNLLPLIKTEVRDGILFVTTDQELNATKTINLRISLPELLAVTSHGAGQVNITDAVGDNLKLESMGAASVDATGKVKTTTISSTGAGKINTTKLLAEKATVNVTGAAAVEVYASEQLDVTVSGAGSVSYSGNPKVVNKNVSGIGNVSKADE